MHWLVPEDDVRESAGERFHRLMCGLAAGGFVLVVVIAVLVAMAGCASVEVACPDFPPLRRVMTQSGEVLIAFKADEIERLVKRIELESLGKCTPVGEGAV
jgi:hypothetical protein